MDRENKKKVDIACLWFLSSSFQFFANLQEKLLLFCPLLLLLPLTLHGIGGIGDDNWQMNMHSCWYIHSLRKSEWNSLIGRRNFWNVGLTMTEF
jgi:hypothetical protein